MLKVGTYDIFNPLFKLPPALGTIQELGPRSVRHWTGHFFSSETAYS
jgi:hypothetical protein